MNCLEFSSSFSSSISLLYSARIYFSYSLGSVQWKYSRSWTACIPSIPISFVNTGIPEDKDSNILTFIPAPKTSGATKHIALSKYGSILSTNPVIITLSDFIFFNSSEGLLPNTINLIFKSFNNGITLFINHNALK